MQSARRLTQLSAVLSGLFSAGLGWAYWQWQSDLALAQAADSLLDFAAGILLAWAVVVAQIPGDERHPMGHARAEPLGALAVAALAGILAIEVATSSVKSLLGEPNVVLSWNLLGLFVGKAAFRGIVWRLARTEDGAAFSALAVDARNDLLVSGVAILGFLGAQAGAPLVDPALALPAALWIGWSGVELARENIHLLLGVAPSKERQAQLLEVASGTPGIVDAHDLTAYSTGVALSVNVHVSVDENLTVREGHDLGEQVRQRLLAEPDVSHCSVHVDPSE